MFENIINPLCQGLRLSIFTFLFSIILDFTISSETLAKSLDKNSKLYIKGIQANIINLFILSPIYYLLLDLLFFDNNTNYFDILKFINLTLTHNILYYIGHKAMHKIKYLNSFHDFHHEFKITVPTNGNAVSISEYNFAYVLPFVLGIIIFRPNSVTLNGSVFIISFFNTLIHCHELSKIKWPKFLVSPFDHGVHHKNKSGTYSAPIINIDRLLGNN